MCPNSDWLRIPYVLAFIHASTKSSSVLCGSLGVALGSGVSVAIAIPEAAMSPVDLWGGAMYGCAMAFQMAFQQPSTTEMQRWCAAAGRCDERMAYVIVDAARWGFEQACARIQKGKDQSQP